MMNPIEGRAVFALYDELNEAHKRLGREEFRRELTHRCAEFRQEHPGSSAMLVAMQQHFAARDRP